MQSAGRPAWLPPFLVGAVAAMAGELTAGLLVYSTQGFLRSLTVVLAVELLGLGLGLASAHGLPSGALASIRRRWLLLVVSLAAAAGFAGAWGMRGGFQDAAWSQVAGLALLGGFPLFSAGAVLGALSSPVPGRAMAAPAALGAAVGIVATGLLGVPRLEPVSFFLVGVVAASAAALVHGRVLDGGVVVRVLAESRDVDGGPVLRLEERIRGDRHATARLWTVDGHPAAGVAPEGGPLLAWEGIAARAFQAEGMRRTRVLLVGVPQNGLGAVLGRNEGGREVETWEPWKRLEGFQRGAPSSPRGGFTGLFGGVIVNLRLLPGGGPLAGAGLAALEEAGRARAGGGVLFLGGAPGHEGGRQLARWVAGRPWSPERVVLLRPRGPGPGSAFLRPGEDWGGGLLVGLPLSAGDPWDPEWAEAILQFGTDAPVHPADHDPGGSSR